MWKTLLQRVVSKHLGGTCIFNDPVPALILDAAEHTLRCTLPSDLRDLLGETDGVAVRMLGNGYDYEDSLLWSLENILAANQARDLDARWGATMQHLLLFADAGNGDLFGFGVDARSQAVDEIYTWNHESEEVMSVAEDLQTFLRGWFGGTIAV